MTLFGLVFLLAVCVTTLVRLWLAQRQRAHVQARRGAVPKPFAHEIDLPAHQRAADYTAAKTRLAMFDAIAEALLALWLTLGGGIQWFSRLADEWFTNTIAHGLAVIVLLAIAGALVELPFTLYRTFVIEERFGFNRMTPKLFVVDLLKGIAVGAVLLLPLVAAILWFMEAAYALWWFYAWLVVVLFSVFVNFIAPTVIAPIFNKFTPLENPQVKERVLRLLERCDFKVRSLLVMDGSRRSSHGNAYFAGFGRSKRVVFFDTLLSRLEAGEVEAVLAHELGHYKLRHIIKRIVLVSAVSFLFFWLLNFLMQQDWFFAGLGVTTPSTGAALALFYVALPYFTLLLQPLGAMYSRKHEYEADRYAAGTSSARDLATALVKLYRDNASTLTPDPLHSAFYDSHPPALARIARLQQLAEQAR
jgi:STE24 endopeptidase